MVLPGADRESSSESPRSHFDDRNGQRDERVASRSGAQQMEQQVDPIYTVDLHQIDMDALYAKKRSLVRYFNPSYHRFFAVSTSLSILRAQVRAQRPLTSSEMSNYAEAVVSATNSGILYKRAILWPATVAILAFSRGRTAPVASGLVKRIVSNVFNYRRPGGQFTLAWLTAGAVEGMVTASRLNDEMLTNPALSSLRDDLQAVERRGNHKDEDYSTRRADTYQDANGQMQQHLTDSSTVVGHAGERDGSDLEYRRAVHSTQDTLAQYPHAPANTATSFDSVGYDRSSVDRYFGHDEEMTSEPKHPGSLERPRTGAWERLRKQSEAERQQPERHNSRASWEQRRNAAFGNNSGSDDRRSNYAIKSEQADEVTTTEADIWQQRRDFGSHEGSSMRSTNPSPRSGVTRSDFESRESTDSLNVAEMESQEEFDRRVDMERQAADLQPSDVLPRNTRW